MKACESFLVFELPEGSRHHEDVNPSGTGVDFEINRARQTWLEVKGFEAPLPEHEDRLQLFKSFESKLASDSFWSDIAKKFVGTSQVLRRRTERGNQPMALLMLDCRREPIRALAPFGSILRREILRCAELSDCTAQVLTLSDFNEFIDDCSATPCSATYEACETKAPRCSLDRRMHKQKQP